ncbi:MAG: peptide deformylase [Oceanicoccus sp.]|jgi:peptide deformylase
MTLRVETGRKNEILRTVSKPVEKITKDLKHFALNLIDTMNAESGVGLAAPQAGRNIRMVACKFNPSTKNELTMIMVNPEIIEKSDEIKNDEEGCLSLPEEWGMVDRATSVMVRFQTLKGATQTLEFFDFNARIIQHEIDHLNGILFVDLATEMNSENQGEGRPESRGEDDRHQAI